MAWDALRLPEEAHTGKRTLRNRRNHALGTGAEPFYDEPLEIARGDGVLVFDRNGRSYVDMYNNVPVGDGASRPHFHAQFLVDPTQLLFDPPYAAFDRTATAARHRTGGHHWNSESGVSLVGGNRSAGAGRDSERRQVEDWRFVNPAVLSPGNWIE